MMKYSGKRFILALIFLLLAAPLVMAGTTVSDTDKYSWGPDIGWLNWQGDKTNGVVFDNTQYLSGYIWSANCGWIDTGDGSPDNSICYGNNTATDYGLNMLNNQLDYYYLYGYAWSPNIGWINFDADLDFAGQFGERFCPRISKTTGVMSGYAWSPNAGWLCLSSEGIALVDLNGSIKVESTGWMLR
jgi:hypothetical protein